MRGGGANNEFRESTVDFLELCPENQSMSKIWALKYINIVTTL